MSELIDIKPIDAIEELSFNEILNEIKVEFNKLLPDIDLIESDRYSAILELMAYREILFRSRINHAYKSTLLPFATGVDLDYIVTLYGIKRENGVYPKADIEFVLSKESDKNIIIAKGVILTSGSGRTAKLKENVIILKGEKSARGVTELLEYVVRDEVKCEVIQTPLPFLINAKQLSDFRDGGEVESDESLRVRSILSLKSITSAGSEDSYIFHTLSADTRVEDVVILSPIAGVVEVNVLTREVKDESILDNVYKKLSDKTVRPLTDIVEVKFAKSINVEIHAVIELTDLLKQAEVDNEIKSNLPQMKLGEDFNISRIYKLLHVDNVYRVKLIEPIIDIKVAKDEYVNINDLSIEYKIAEL